MSHAMSGASLRRLPQYMKLLARLAEAGQQYVTSADLAWQLKLDETLVRKDLALTGFTGKPRVGFVVQGLLEHLEAFLGLHEVKEAILVGAGRLGQALTSYQRLEKYGLRIVGLFDKDTAKIGQCVAGQEIQPLWQAPATAREQHIHIAILTVPPDAAQGVADMLVDAGITAFWNFSGRHLKLPATILVHNEDLADSFAVLSHRVITHDVPVTVPEGDE